MDKEGSPALRSTSVNLPTKGLSKDDQFVVELQTKDAKWMPQTIDSKTIHKLVQVIKPVNKLYLHVILSK